ncbi:cell number regulator 6-like [Andrographis paniculata]|uniref:cell number regulator 6-like n=1 Tax=Andrographis paniculata TaxID=175694 RepID=UPI0021E72B6E|nr:cell number regulator 6-like [Andrographis paniculata]
MDGERTYVKLSEEQRQLQNVTPGELNEAINIDQLHGRTCEQCGQVLPATYIPPADEDWMTGIFGCLEDTESCKNGLFCPCVLFGQNVAALNSEIAEQNACVSHAVCVEGGIALAALTIAFNGMIDPDTVCLLTEGLLFGWWVCAIYTGMGRQLLQRRYHLKDSPCDPCLVHCTLHWCAICQEHREMRRHLSDRTSSATTVVDPPELQEMNAAAAADNKPPEAAPPRPETTEHNNLQLVPVSRNSV